MTPYLILGGLVLLGAFLWFARKSGKDSVRANIGEQNAEASKRVAEAIGSAPGSKSDVLVRLRDPKRKL